MPRAVDPLHTRFPWERLFCDRGESVPIGDDGYLVDPGSWYGRAVGKGVLRLEALLTKRCVVILGEAGIGKTVVLETVVERLRGEHGDDSVVEVRLGEYGSVDSLERGVFESSELAECVRGPTELWLVLDSLDEAMVGVQNVVGLFQRRLREWPWDRLRVVISCRTAAWPATLEGELKGALPEKSLQVVELLPLLRCDVATAATARELDSERFLREIDERDAQPLASNPLSLEMLLGVHAGAGGLPNRRVELFDKGLRLLCAEPRARRDHGTVGTLTADQRFELATRIAGVSVLAGKAAIERDPPPVGVGEGITLRDLIDESRAGSGAGKVDVTEDSLREALDTGLFTARGTTALGFAHKSYAAFLAARYVQESGFSKQQRDELLRVADGGNRALVPQLAETACWRAGRTSCRSRSSSRRFLRRGGGTSSAATPNSCFTATCTIGWRRNTRNQRWNGLATTT